MADYVPFSSAGDFGYGGNNSNPFPRPSSGLYGRDLQNAQSTGYTNKWGDTWTSGAHPGQYLTTADVQALAKKQQQAENLMSPGYYQPGVDYSAAVSPYLSTGTLSSLVSSGPSEVSANNEYETRLRQLLQDPNSIADTGAYKFALGQGQQALERSMAAKGMSGSGNTLAELLKYGQGMASQQYNTEANRLAQLTGQQNQYILGQRGANVADYNARLQGAQTGLGAGSLALRAAEDKSGDFWKGRQMSNQAANDLGYFKGPQGQSIW